MRNVLSHSFADKFFNSSLCQSRESIGIYIGDEHISITRTEHSLKEKRITLSKIIPSPVQKSHNYSPEEKEKIAAAIKENMGDKEYHLSNTVFGIPRQHVIVKRITIPAPEEKMVEDVLKYEIEKHIPFKASEAYYDFCLIAPNEGEKTFDIALVAIRKSSLDDYIDIAKRADLEISGIEISTSAALNILPQLDSGSSLSENTLYIPILKSGEYFEIILSMGRKFIASRSIKVTEDSGKSDRLSEEIKKTVDNYSELNGSAGVKPIIIPIGQGGIDSSILGELETKTGYRTRVGSISPDSKITTALDSGDKPLSGKEEILSYALTLRGKESILRLNLLPPSIRKKRVHQGLISLLLTTVILLLLFFIGAEGYLKEKSILKQTNKQLSLLKKKASLVEDIYLRKDELEKGFYSFEHISSSITKRRDILLELTEIVPNSIWIKAIDISGDNIELLGYADNSSMLINILEDSPLFNNIKFIGRIRKEGSKERFKLRGRITAPNNR